MEAVVMAVAAAVAARVVERMEVTRELGVVATALVVAAKVVVEWLAEGMVVAARNLVVAAAAQREGSSRCPSCCTRCRSWRCQ